jgi:type II secretory pathway pseudopilin PulG
MAGKPPTTRSARHQRGFTLMEIIVILGVIAVLTTVLAPMVVAYLEDAYRARAESDVRQIAAAILKFHQDTGRFPYHDDGDESGAAPDFVLLTGPGDVPADGAPPAQWAPGSSARDSLDNQLQRNEPGGDPAPARKYSTTGRFAWRGPYLRSLGDDPWGTQYVVNVGKLQPGLRKQAWVISAGPNRTIDTRFDVATTDAPALGGDDIGARLQ